MRDIFRKCVLFWDDWRYFRRDCYLLNQPIHNFGLRVLRSALASLLILASGCVFEGMEGEALGVYIEVDDEGCVVVHLNRIKERKVGVNAPL